MISLPGQVPFVHDGALHHGATLRTVLQASVFHSWAIRTIPNGEGRDYLQGPCYAASDDTLQVLNWACLLWKNTTTRHAGVPASRELRDPTALPYQEPAHLAGKALRTMPRYGQYQSSE